jgi:hypothetical protein
MQFLGVNMKSGWGNNPNLLRREIIISDGRLAIIGRPEGAYGMARLRKAFTNGGQK